MSRNLSLLLLAVAGALLMPAGTLAQVTSARPGVDLSGFWMLRYDASVDTIMPSGNALTGYIPPAPLTPEAARAVAKAAQPESLRTTIPTSVGGSRWCRAQPYPFFMRSPEAIDIVQGDRQVMVTGDRIGAMRHIHLDQPTHPDNWEPTVMGHVIGRWEGDTLVADTIGLSGGGIPGALAANPRTHLVERYKLLPDGRLSITFTWEDSTQFTAPHTYELIYYRQPPDTYAYENFCDPSDPSQYVEPIRPAGQAAP